MPMKITHPFHKEHVFTLLPNPAYPEGLFNCDACGQTGKGFSYHCKPCGVDLHILCAVMPLALTCIHHPHELKLTFGDKSFSCDICKIQVASRHWLYRCNPCGFDAHLNCARGHAPTVAPSMGFQTVGPPPQQAGFGPQFVVGAPHQQGFTSGPTNVAGVFGVNSHNNESITQTVQQIMNHSIATNQAILAGGIGGGFVVNNQSNESISQAIQQMINQNNAMAQSLLAAGGFGGSPASVGGFGGLNAIGGGGAGGQDYLQGLMNGGGSGGGGGFDLQSLLGGGNVLDFLGGGGGLDVLGGAMGGFSL
ncbi:hypothetical protein OROMI_014273 [Orobanche minor]